MPRTIGNPGSFVVSTLGEATRSAAHALGRIGGPGGDAAVPEPADLDGEDIREALRAGFDDFLAFRADVMFIVLIYPLIGLGLAMAAFDRSLLPLLFPAAAGFAIVGPFAALGLYEMSRQRETGDLPRWSRAFAVLGSERIGSILALGAVLAFLFVVWIGVAGVIHDATMGPEVPASVAAFATDVLTTGPGWKMILIGVPVGGVFATLALAISLTSFPMLVDRDVGLPTAVIASVRTVLRNPLTAFQWGAVVTFGLVLGSLPAFLGLIVVLPVLGHATWHLYRRAFPVL